MIGRRLSTASTLAACLAWSAPVSAQVSAYLLVPPPSSCATGCAGRIAAVDVDGRRVLWTADIPAAYGLTYGGVYTTPDGRFVVWQGGESDTLPQRVVGLLDVVTRQVATIPLSKPAPSPLPPALVGNPWRPEVYTVDATGPITLSPAGVRAFTCAACGPLMSVESISADGRRVLYRGGSTLAVFDTASGAVIAERTYPPGFAGLSRDGLEIYMAVDGLGSPDLLRRYRASDGVLLHEVPLTAGAGPLRIDARTGDVFIVGGGLTLSTFVETSLALRRTSAFAPWYHQYSGSYTWMFDPNTPNIYVTSSYIVELGGAFNRFVVFDGATFAPVLYLDQATPSNENPGIFAPAPRPGAPTLAATVQGNAVSLLWSPAAAAAATTRYVLDVGSAPGLSDIFSGLDLGLQTSFGASGVPPGRYYVRVRAGNYSGLSASSNEVVVQVP